MLNVGTVHHAFMGIAGSTVVQLNNIAEILLQNAAAAYALCQVKLCTSRVLNARSLRDAHSCTRSMQSGIVCAFSDLYLVSYLKQSAV